VDEKSKELVREPSILHFKKNKTEAGGSLILKIFKELELEVL
jgi:hypothetical protein